MRNKLNEKINKPIFVSGLARSGSTILTNILNVHDDTGSFLYRDAPFIEMPYLWSFANRFFYAGIKEELRPHNDGLRIGPNSPDPFEEIIWKKYLDNYLDINSQFIKRGYSNNNLETSLKKNILKILYVRGNKKRYLSKGNYNITRIEYILKIFPDAKIILCIRNPYNHVESLVNVHNKFTDYCKKNKYLVKQLNILSHFEFGPQRKPICLNKINYKKILDLWSKSDHYLGYLIQWHDIYQMVLKKYLISKKISKNILVIDNQDLLLKPKETITKILNFADLEYKQNIFKQMLSLVSKKMQKSFKKKNRRKTYIDNTILKLYKKIKEISYKKK